MQALCCIAPEGSLDRGWQAHALPKFGAKKKPGDREAVAVWP